MTDREMIIELATKVMGWTIIPHFPNSIFPDTDLWETPLGKHFNSGTFRPLTSIADAWQIVEKMGGMWLCPAENGHGWRAGKLSIEDPPREGNWSPGVYADSAPRAICLAALKAVAA